jgi:hypothetical protein
VNEKPGTSSSVIAAPPTTVPPLEDQRAQPRLGEVAALTRPLWPPPTTIASYSSLGPGNALGRGRVWGAVMGMAVFLAGLNKGSFAVRAGTVVLVWFDGELEVHLGARSGGSGGPGPGRCGAAAPGST